VPAHACAEERRLHDEATAHANAQAMARRYALVWLTFSPLRAFPAQRATLPIMTPSDDALDIIINHTVDRLLILLLVSPSNKVNWIQNTQRNAMSFAMSVVHDQSSSAHFNARWPTWPAPARHHTQPPAAPCDLVAQILLKLRKCCPPRSTRGWQKKLSHEKPAFHSSMSVGKT
jgi:hypothetical protein